MNNDNDHTIDNTNTNSSRRVFSLSTPWSPLEDSRLFGPSRWKILAATNDKYISEQPSPWRKYYKRESCYGDRV